MRIYSGGRVERTEVLPLFNILTHTSMNSRGRYEVDYLEKMQVRKEELVKRRERLRQRDINKYTGVKEELPSEQLNPDNEEDEESDMSDMIDKGTSWPRGDIQRQEIEDDDTEAAFLALTYFLEVSSRQQMPPSRAKEGVFPTEIYGMILLHLEDLQTRHACMQVSRSFRDLCQQNSMMMDGVVVQAVTTSPTSAWARGLRIKTLSTGQSHDVTLEHMPLQTPRSRRMRGPEKQPESRWQVVLGSERNRRSILPHLAVGFTRSESGNESVRSRHGTKAVKVAAWPGGGSLSPLQQDISERKRLATASFRRGTG